MINTKEHTIINSIKDTFEGENMQTQYSVLGYRIDLYFHEYKLAIEVDERQKALEKELNCIFIRINRDEKDFNIFKKINKIHRHSKKFLMTKFKKNQLELKFRSNNLIITKTLKKVIKKKHFNKLQKMKNTISNIKPIKTGKQSGTTYYFGCKDYIKNFRPEKVKMINMVLREKSHCVVCQSNKSGFLKQKIN